MISRLFRALAAVAAGFSLLLALGVGYAWWQGVQAGLFFAEGAAFGVRGALISSSGRMSVRVVRYYPGRAFVSAVAGHDASRTTPRPHVFVDSFIPSRTEQLSWPRLTVRRDTRLTYLAPGGGVAEFALEDLPALRPTARVVRGLPAITVSGLDPRWVVGGLLVLPVGWAVSRAVTARRKRGRGFPAIPGGGGEDQSRSDGAVVR